jgi:hypothetical protein
MLFANAAVKLPFYIQRLFLKQRFRFLEKIGTL